MSERQETLLPKYIRKIQLTSLITSAISFADFLRWKFLKSFLTCPRKHLNERAPQNVQKRFLRFGSRTDIQYKHNMKLRLSWKMIVVNLVPKFVLL